MSKGKEAVSMKARLLIGLALGLTCLAGALALLVGHGSVFAINGFSDNQELPLPPLAPIANSGVSFIVRGLEPSVRVAPDGTVYVSSIRGVPGGVDVHRYFATVGGPTGVGSTYPFKYESQPDNCGIFDASQGGFDNNRVGPLAAGLQGGDIATSDDYHTTGHHSITLNS